MSRSSHSRRAAVWASAVLVGLMGCSSGNDTKKVAVIPTPVDPATAGTIAVTVSAPGSPPAPKVIDMRIAPQCVLAHPEPVSDPSLLVHDGRVANAFVWIKGGLDGWVFAIPDQPVPIDQKGCMYHPHVAGAMVGQSVKFTNSDAEPHNVHGQPSVLSGWNFLMHGNTSRMLTFDKPEIGVPIGCDIHPWMHAYLGVVTNPFYAVTPVDGAVTLTGVPPGTYVVGVWHEKLGGKEQTVTLPPSGSASVQFTYAG